MAAPDADVVAVDVDEALVGPGREALRCPLTKDSATSRPDGFSMTFTCALAVTVCEEPPAACAVPAAPVRASAPVAVTTAAVRGLRSLEDISHFLV